VHHVQPGTAISGWSGRLGSITAGGALAGAAAFVALRDPSAPGSFLPGCTFHRMTGWWCPGCGLTRGVHHLLHGDIARAVGSNVFTPLVVAATVTVWMLWVGRSFGVAPVRVRPGPRARRWSGVLIVAAMVAYTALRNVPVAPLTALAP
jgi:hypothetical protein